MPSIKSVSAAQSVVSTDVSVLAADGVAVCTVYITCNLDFQDANGQPYPIGGVPASLVTIAIAAGGVVITQPTGNLSADGTTTATFTASVANSKTIVATINGVAATSSPVVVAGGSITPPAPGDPFYEQLATSGNVFNTINGVSWGTRPSTVTEQAVPAGKTGYGIRFRLGPDAAGEDSTAEQRFAIGQNLTEIWMQYDLFVPSGYVHRNDTGPDNNKFLRLWGDSYSLRNKVGLSTRPWASTGPDSKVFWEYTLAGETGLTENGNYRLLDDTARNAWTQIRIYAKHVTSDGASDAAFKVWRDGTLALDLSGINQRYVTGQAYWNNGYLFGWANSGFLAETDLYTFEMKMWSTSPGWT